MKHISIYFHFVRDKVEQGSLIVFYISGDDQLADALTKPLSHTRFEQLRSKIGVSNGVSILWGHDSLDPSRDRELDLFP